MCTRDDELLRLARGNGSWTADRLLDGAGVQCVAATGAQVLLGTRDRGVLLSEDGGLRWGQFELPAPQVFSVAIGAADGSPPILAAPSRPTRCPMRSS